MHTQRPLKNVSVKNQTYWSLPIIKLFNVLINRMETFQHHCASDLIIFNSWIVNINNVCSETKEKKWGVQWNNWQGEMLSSDFEWLISFLLKNITTNKMFLQNISILTKQHFLVEDIPVKKPFQQNVLQAPSLIIQEHSALSNVSNAKLVLLCVWL